MSLYVVKRRETLSWISLQIFLNIFILRKKKLPSLRKELAYKTVPFLSHSKNSQYVLYRTWNTRILPRVLYPIKHSCSFFKHYIKTFKNLQIYTQLLQFYAMLKLINTSCNLTQSSSSQNALQIKSHRKSSAPKYWIGNTKILPVSF